MMRVRRSLALPTLLVAALALAACTTVPESEAPADECVPASSPTAVPGGAADAVTVSGAFGSAVQVEMPTPLRADRVQVATEGGGQGSSITPHGVFEANVTLVNGADGAELVPYGPIARNANGDSRPVSMTSVVASAPGLASSIACARTGQRIVAALSGAAYFGEQPAAQLGLTDTTVVAVVDVTRVYPSAAWGTVLPPEEGFPAVVTAPDGQPGASMPNQAPPLELRTSVRVSGLGREIEAGDLVTMQVSVFGWESGHYLGSTWDESNAVMQIDVPSEPGEDQLYGAAAQLAGHRVGSQIIIVVPADQAQRYSGPISSYLTRGQTVVLVVDVLESDGRETR